MAGHKKIRQGTVVSDKMDKTVVVRVEHEAHRSVRHLADILEARLRAAGKVSVDRQNEVLEDDDDIQRVTANLEVSDEVASEL